METDFRTLFNSPADYTQPNENELAGNTQYPNMNSVEYRRRQYQPTEPTFYETITTNATQSTILLVANSYVNRFWDSTIHIYKQFDDIEQTKQSQQQLRFNTNVNHIRFIDDMLVMLTTANGMVQIWSTHSEARQQTGYSMYKVASRHEHYNSISAFDMAGKTTAISGSMDGCLKIWSIEPCDFYSTKTFRKAHSDEISGISVKPDHESIFVSCSSDGLVAIWDARILKPVLRYSSTSEIGYTACKWHLNNGAEKLYLGDETGRVSVFDPRKLDTSEDIQKIYDQSIKKISFNGNGDFLCVLGNSHTFKVFERTISGAAIYENSDATDFVRDISWMNADIDKKTRFYSIGWNKHVMKHSI